MNELKNKLFIKMKL